MESTLEERGVMPVAVTWWPRKKTEGCAKVHLERLTRRPLALRMSRSCVRWERCWEKLELATRMSSR